MVRMATYAALVGMCLSAFAVLASPSATQAGEVKVKIDQVPEVVRAAILEQVGDGRLVDIGVFTDGDKKTYEIEMVVDGEEYDVLFAADGSVLRKTFEGRKTDAGASSRTPPGATDGYQDAFDLDSRQLVSKGRNRFFVLEPGYQLVLEGNEGERQVSLTITVLDETKKLGGIETRVVEEREVVDGELIEISRNFFALCQETKSVFYFGEEVDLYEDGEVVGHEGAWLHGEQGARAGLMMPGDPILGASYYQEVAPGVAMDRGRIAAVDATLTTPLGTFEHCLEVQEENPLDQEKESKLHAPGVGLVQDEDLLLVRYGFVQR